MIIIIKLRFKRTYLLIMIIKLLFKCSNIILANDNYY